MLENENPKHSPIHDLESIVWLLLWVIGRKAVEAVEGVTGRDSKVTRIQRGFLRHMDPSHESLDAASSKCEFICSLSFQLTINRLPWLAPFASLLSSLTSLIQKYYQESTKRHDNPLDWFTQDEIEKAFEEYLDVFERNLPQEESWEYLREL